VTEALVSEILSLARAKGATVTTAESCTGGMVSAALTDVAGSSDMFGRGFVTYSNAAKSDLLGVAPETLQAFGAVSEEVARDMATGARDAAKATVAVAISGIAGPGGSEHKPEGRVCFAVASERGVISETIEFGAPGRAQVRTKATRRALELIRDTLTTM
jgi:nicotinamide-nucleotide amidase